MENREKEFVELVQLYEDYIREISDSSERPDWVSRESICRKIGALKKQLRINELIEV